MIRVYNGTGSPNVLSQLGITMRPGEWTPLPWAAMLQFVGREGYKIEMQFDEEQPLWKEADGLHVYWLSPWSVSDGYSIAAEVLVHALIAAGVHLDVNAVWFDTREGLRAKTLCLLEEPSLYPHQVGIVLAQPEEFCHLPTPYKIGWTMYETDDPLELKPHWRHACNDVDLLLVPSDYCQAVFARFVTKPIKVAPLAVDPRYTYVERPPDRPFTLATWGVLSARKGPLEAIECFQAAFPRTDYPDVRFVLKTRHGVLGAGGYAVPQIDDPRIEVIDEDWRDIRLMLKFVNRVDVAIFLSKGEGFGMPAREAMATGLPTILADNSGHSDVCSQRYNFPVPTARMEKSPMGGRWAIPDNDVAIEHLRWIYHNREQALRRAKRASDYMAAHHDHCAAARNLIAILEQIDPTHTTESRSVMTWSEMYPVASVETLRHLQAHHEHFFNVIREIAAPPTRLLEIGLGTGAFYAKLVTAGYEVCGLDNNARVIETATQAVAQVDIIPDFVQGDAFALTRALAGREQPRIIYHQGLLEHFSDAEIRAMITESLRVAEYVVFSVPSVYYPEKTKGDERLMGIAQWREILSPFKVERLEYYQHRLHILAVIARGPNVRGTMIRERR